MYKSPIDVYITQMVDSYRKQRDAYLEDEVYSAVERVGVVVDKDELLRALSYDRNQYRKGYMDGVEAANIGWISANNPPKEPGTHLAYMRYPNGETETIWSIFHPDHGWSDENGIGAPVVEYWIPFSLIPKPTKEVNIE